MADAEVRLTDVLTQRTRVCLISEYKDNSAHHHSLELFW